MKKVKLPTIDKKNFPYDLVQILWEDIVGDAGWAELLFFHLSSLLISKYFI